MLKLLTFFTLFDPQIPFFPNGIGFTFLISLLLFFPTIKTLQQGKGQDIMKLTMPFYFLFVVVFFLC